MKARLAVVDADVVAYGLTLVWEYRYLNVSSYSRSATASVRQFEPLMLRTFSTVLTNAKIPSMPNILVDFGQWRETFNLSCYLAGTTQDMMEEISDLRRWIREVQGNTGKRIFLQIFPGDTVGHEGLDPGLTPLGMVPGYGYRGMVTSGPAEKYNAGEERMEYNLAFSVGIVMPF